MPILEVAGITAELDLSHNQQGDYVLIKHGEGTGTIPHGVSNEYDKAAVLLKIYLIHQYKE